MSSEDNTLSLGDHELLLQLVSMSRDFGTRLQTGLDSIFARLQEHDSRLESLETTGEARLYDTRPIWEAVQHQVSDLQQQITELRSSVQQQITEIRTEIKELRTEVEKGFRMVNRKVGLFGEQVAELYAYQRDIEDRIEKPEPKA